MVLFPSYFPTTDVNSTTKHGQTALMMVIENNDEKCLIALCESFPNIDPNAQNEDDNSTLMSAICTNNHISAARIWYPIQR